MVLAYGLRSTWGSPGSVTRPFLNLASGGAAELDYIMKMRRLMAVLGMLVLVGMVGCAPAPTAQVAPKRVTVPPAEGWVLFDSRRDGQFDIYKMRPDGSEVTRLTNTPDWEVTPAWSPDGKQIAYCRKGADHDDIGGDLWLMDADGGNQRLLTRGGTSPQFTAEGDIVVFERDRTEALGISLANGRMGKIPPSTLELPFPHLVMRPRVSPDNRLVAFISDKGGRWNSWVTDFAGRMTHLGKGCEPTWHPDGKSLFFVRMSGFNDTVIMRYALPGGPPERFVELAGTLRHVYFPSVSADGRFLLFAACPWNQHDHTESHYQIFIMDLAGGEPLRISHNDFNDRWPTLR